jgi:hypothetical protein
MNSKRQLRDGTTVSTTAVVSRSLGGAYFRVVLGFVLLAFLIWAIVSGAHTLDTRSIIEYVVAFLILVGYLPRSIRGLFILRGEARRRPY